MEEGRNLGNLCIWKVCNKLIGNQDMESGEKVWMRYAAENIQNCKQNEDLCNLNCLAFSLCKANFKDSAGGLVGHEVGGWGPRAG